MIVTPERSVLGLPPRTAVVYLLLFAVACVTYTRVWRQAPVQEGDSPQYLEVAQDLSDSSLDALHDRTPGYPLLLVLTGSSQQPTRTLFFVSLALHFASIWLLAAVLHSAGVSHAWLLIFCGLLILPPYVEPAAYVMTENLAQFALAAGLSCLALWFSVRRVMLLAVSAVAFAYAGVTRPAYQLLALAISACLVMMPAIVRRAGVTYGDAARASGILVAGSLLILGGLSSLNYAKFKYFGVIPSIGFHLSTKTMPFIERLPEEYAAVREILIRERDAQLVKRGGPHTGLQAIWGVKSELAAVTGLSTPQLSGYLLKMNLELIRKAPIEYLQEVARSMSVYWFPPATALANMRSSALRWVWAIVHLLLVGVFFLQIAVLVSVVVLHVSHRIAGSTVKEVAPAIAATGFQALSYILAGVIVFYTMGLSCALDIGEVRQRRSTDVLIVFMCFLGAHVWWQTIRNAESGMRSPECGIRGT